MYCRKCGKWIEGDNEFCADCQETEIFFSSEAEKEPVKATTVASQLPGSRKTGMTKALIGAIFGAVGYLLAMIGLGLISGALEEIDEFSYSYNSVETLLKDIHLYGFTVFCAIVPLLLFVPGLVLGIMSISCFKKEKNAGRVKPIPTLVLGIVGVVLGALNALMSVCLFALLAL